MTAQCQGCGGPPSAKGFASVWRVGVAQRQGAVSLHLPLEPLRDVGGAEDLAAQRAKGLRRLLETSLNVVVVGQVEVEQRAEVHERLREADGAATVEQQQTLFASNSLLVLENTWVAH